MARNAKQCPLFSSGKVLFSVSFYFGTQTKKLFSVSCYIGIKITPQLPHSCHTVTPQLTFLCALPQQVPYKHPTSNPTSYPTSWQVRSRRAFRLFTSARWSTSAASSSSTKTVRIQWCASVFCVNNCNFIPVVYDSVCHAECWICFTGAWWCGQV